MVTCQSDNHLKTPARGAFSELGAPGKYGNTFAHIYLDQPRGSFIAMMLAAAQWCPIETFLKTIGYLQRFIHIKSCIRENEKSVKNIAYIDQETPLMSYQRKPTCNFSLFNLGLSTDSNI